MANPYRKVKIQANNHDSQWRCQEDTNDLIFVKTIE